MQQVIIYLHTFMSPLLFSVSSGEHFEQPKIALLLAVGLTLMAAWGSNLILLESTKKKIILTFKNLKNDPIGIGFLTFLFSCVISTITSISPRTSLLGGDESYAGLFAMIAYTILYFATRQVLKDKADLRRLISIAVIATAGTCAYVISQILQWDPISWRRILDSRGIMRPLGTIGHPNFLSAYLVMALPTIGLLTYQSFKKSRYFISSVFFIICIISLVSIALSQSRGAWFALAAVATFVSVMVVRYGKKKLGYLTLFIIPGIIFLAGVATFLVRPESGKYGLMLFNLRERFEQLFVISSRVAYWKGAWNVIKKYPLFGGGLDNFHITFAHQRTPEFWAADWAIAPHKAHNEILNILANQGIVGFLAVCLLIYAITKTFFSTYRQSTKESKPLLLAIGAGILGFFIQNIPSFTVSTTGVFFVTLSAGLSRFKSLGDHEQDQKIAVHRYTKIITAGFLCFLLMLFHNFYPIDERSYKTILIMAVMGLVASIAVVVGEYQGKLKFIKFAKGAGYVFVCLFFFDSMMRVVILPFYANITSGKAYHMEKFKPVDALVLYEKAVTIDRHLDRHAVRVGSLAHRLATNSKDLTEKKEYRELAMRSYDYAKSLSPQVGDYHFTLGLILADLTIDHGAKLSDQSLAELEETLRLEPNNPVYLWGFIGTAITFGRFDRALSHAERFVYLYPNFRIPHYQLGYLKQSKGLLTEALDHYEKAMFLGTEFNGAREEMIFSGKPREFTKKQIEIIKGQIKGL